MSSVVISGRVPAVGLEPHDSLFLEFLRALGSDRDEQWLVREPLNFYVFPYEFCGDKWFGPSGETRTV